MECVLYLVVDGYLYHCVILYIFVISFVDRSIDRFEQGYAWAEDKEHCEEYGRMLQADPSKVSKRAKKRGLPQLGTLGAGNHYCEIQVVDEIFDPFAAARMGIDKIGQICIMIHSGSRGLGHQVATDALTAMENAMVCVCELFVYLFIFVCVRERESNEHRLLCESCCWYGVVRWDV